MNHKVYGVTAVYVLYNILQTIIIFMRVADESKAYGVLIQRSILDERNVLGVDTFLATYMNIVRMDIKHRVASSQCKSATRHATA